MMSVEHRYWSIPVDRLAEGLAPVRGPEDLWRPDVTAVVSSLRRAPEREEQLQLLGMDPRDDEIWSVVTEPRGADERDISLALRLALLLVPLTKAAGGIRFPGLLEELLLAHEWSQADVDLAMRGRVLRTLFRDHLPPPASGLGDAAPWLPGGWLDAASAAPLAGRLRRQSGALASGAAEVAAAQSDRTGRPREWHRDRLADGVSDLRSMLARPGGAQAIWIVQG
jgi:hypothetical protein